MRARSFPIHYGDAPAMPRAPHHEHVLLLRTPPTVVRLRDGWPEELLVQAGAHEVVIHVATLDQWDLAARLLPHLQWLRTSIAAYRRWARTIDTQNER